MNQVASQMVLVEVVEVAVAKIVVGDVLGKHVIDGYQDLMRDCPRSALVTTAGLYDFQSALIGCHSADQRLAIRELDMEGQV